MRSPRSCLAALALALTAMLSSCSDLPKQPPRPPVTDPADSASSPFSTDPPPETIPSSVPADSVAPPAQTDSPAVTTPPPAQTEPPIVIPPRIPDLQGDETVLTLTDGRCAFSLDSPSGTNLYLVISGEGRSNADGSLTMTVSLLLRHLNIYCRERLGCLLRVGDGSVTFDTAVISQEESDARLTHLQDLTVTLDPGEVIEIEALVPFYGTYNGVEVNILTLYHRIAVLPEGYEGVLDP